MSFHDCDKKLFDLYYAYTDKYEQLLDRYMNRSYSLEYCRNGEGLHRGYYCPSPLIDIITGGIKRGKITKAPQKDQWYRYVYYKEGDQQQPAIVDTNDNFDGIIKLIEREFIMRDDTVSTAPLYCIFDDEHYLQRISVCQYDALGKITDYSLLTQRLPYGLCTFEKDTNGMELYEEVYRYNKKTGLIDFVTQRKRNDNISSECTYYMKHNDAGYITSFQRVVFHETDIEYGQIYNVPRAKWRMI